MNKKAIFLVILAFLVGLFSSSIYSIYFDSHSINENKQSVAGESLNNGVIKSNNFEETMDKPSPQDRIKNDQIYVYNDEVVIKINNPKWAVFTDTKSMDPVIDSTSKAIEIIPESEEDIQIGDIVAYKPEYDDVVIAHRVADIGYDGLGWYAILKGDNNNYMDPGKIRFEQIKRIVVAIIY